MSPVYGLAESTVGLTFPTEIRRPRIERVKREPMTRFGRAEATSSDDPDAIQVVGLGLPLPGHQIRIMDDLGQELPEREEGELEFKGPSATTGYYHDPEKKPRPCITATGSIPATAPLPLVANYF